MKRTQTASGHALVAGAFALGFIGLTGATALPANANSDSCGVNNFDGWCDDGRPGSDFSLCALGTDFSDCGPTPSAGGGGGGGGGGFSTGLLNPCPFTNDGDCDEPDGLGSCDWGTDVNDCNDPFANFGANPNPNPLPSTGGGGGGTATPAPTVPRPAGIPSTQEGIQIQTALNYFSFNAGGVDGQIGAGTRAAISRYQIAMGFGATGVMPADQLGFLLGAYSWATTQGGAVQTGQSGPALLLAYRARLAGTAAPVAPAPVPVVPAPAPVPQVTAVPVRPQGTAPPAGGLGNFSGITAGGAPASCPTPQNSDGFILVFNGYTSSVFAGNDGNTETLTVANDRSFEFQIGTNALGMRLFGWDYLSDGNIAPGTDYDYVYTGGVVPPVAIGSFWQGTEELRTVDGTFLAPSPVRAQIIDEIPVTIGACTYNVYRGVVTRPTPGNTLETNRYYLHFPGFGLNVFVGSALTGSEPVADLPVAIEIRPDDGI